MSWLSYINPVTWIKSVVTQKYVGSTVRNIIQFIAGALTTSGLVEWSTSEASSWVDVTTKLVSGLLMAGITYGLSLANAKKTELK